MSTWEPTEQWLDERFRRYVQPRLDRGAHRDGRPVLVLLGGQPGAGKSRAAQFAQELHAGRLVEVTGDDFRRLHPEHKRLQQQEPQRMPNVTSAVSGPLVARSIEYARANRCSILLEGVFRDRDVVTRTAIEFHDAGFHVHAIALAVPPEVSRASALGRYLQTLDTAQSRWTPPTAHDSAVAGIPATVESLGGSSAVDRLTVLTREGELLADSTTPGAPRGAVPRQAVETAYTRPLTEAEEALIRTIDERAQRLTRDLPAHAAAAVAAQAFSRQDAGALHTPAEPVTRGFFDSSSFSPKPSQSLGD